MIDLRALYAMATEARDSAHCAYEIALSKRSGDSQTAYDTLMHANRLRDRLYRELIDSL